ncbi:MAG: DUF4197 domain-containing protein [Bacteroidota bacterium]
MMIKKIALLVVCFQLVSCTELQNILGTVGADQLTSEQIGNGLKQALEIGIGKGSDRLSAVDGYLKSQYKILLPEQAQQLTNRLQKVPGFDKVEDKMIERINRAAEDAAKSAKPIFVSAIKQITFQDAMGILKGEKNAATQYLNLTTQTQLYNEFQPVIVRSLNKFNVLDYWEDAINTYNKIPFVEKMNPRLDDYITNRALDGLFSMVEKEELNIRNNISARTSDLLKKVFALQD